MSSRTQFCLFRGLHFPIFKLDLCTEMQKLYTWRLEKGCLYFASLCRGVQAQPLDGSIGLVDS